MCKRRVLLAVTITLVCVLGAPIMRGTGLVSPGGLKGEYFNNLWSYWPYGMPEVIRIDRQIDFNWGNSSPAPGVNANTFTVLWTGYLEAPATDTYTFTIQTDDRVSLRIGGASVVSYSPGYMHSSTHQGKIELTGGQVYAFWMTYQVDKDEAGVQSFWESASLARQIVPASALQPPLLAEDPTPADGERSRSCRISRSSGLQAAGRPTMTSTWTKIRTQSRTPRLPVRGSIAAGSH